MMDENQLMDNLLVRGAWEHFADGFNELFGEKMAKTITVEKVLRNLKFFYIYGDIAVKRNDTESFNNIVGGNFLKKRTFEGGSITSQELYGLYSGWVLAEMGITPQDIKKAVQLDDWYNETETRGKTARKYVIKRETESSRQVNKTYEEKLGTGIMYDDVMERLSYHFHALKNNKDRMSSQNGKEYHDAVVDDIIRKAKLSQEEYDRWFNGFLLEQITNTHQ